MKTTIVPAQITTVEDKVAGSLNFTQLMLLVTPIFVGGVMYAFLPPFISFSLYKTVLTIIIAVVCMSLAIRVKNRLLLEWIIVRSRYNLRPTYYIASKNDLYLREVYKPTEELVTAPRKVRRKIITMPSAPALPKIIQLENVLASPDADFHFKVNRKGGLSVHIKEIK